MLYKVILSIFLISTMTFIMWMMFTIKITNTDYKLEPVKFRRYLEASATVTSHGIPLVTRNEAFYQKGITKIVTGLKREFRSKRTSSIYHKFITYIYRL